MRGWRSMSFRRASEARPFAISSKYFPKRIRPMMIAPVSKYVDGSSPRTPRRRAVRTAVLYPRAAVVPIAMRTSMFALRFRTASRVPR